MVIKMISKIKKLLSNNYKWIICFICLILFLLLAEDVFNNDIMNGDIIGYNFISTYLINDTVTPIMKVITWFGSGVCLITSAILLFVLIKNRKIGFLIYLIYKNVKNKYLRYSLMSILFILIILIGISRVYLGVHYTSDVLGGFLISIAYLILYIRINESNLVTSN